MAHKNNRLESGNGYTNKRMNDSVYAERKQVMDCIYKAKNLLRSKGLKMPRIDIRIVERDNLQTSLGRARMLDNVVWIPTISLTKYKGHLYQIVLHELCHAIWGIEHNEKCNLMHPQLQMFVPLGEFERLFVGYAKKHSNAEMKETCAMSI